MVANYKQKPLSEREASSNLLKFESGPQCLSPHFQQELNPAQRSLIRLTTEERRAISSRDLDDERKNSYSYDDVNEELQDDRKYSLTHIRNESIMMPVTNFHPQYYRTHR